MDGLILINKTSELTSHDVVQRIRKIIKFKKVGHFGILDPLSTGLLIIGVGKATRLFPFYSKMDKTYEGEITLGFATNTYDSSGTPTSAAQKNFPQESILLKEMKKFEGEIIQIPPPFSAKKYKGKPLYALARKKKKFELRPTKVFVHSFELLDFKLPYLFFRIRCSSGTYIRSIAHSLGENLGCGAHLSSLTRTEIGEFKLQDAFKLDEISRIAAEGRLKECLFPLESILPQFPKIILLKKGEELVKNGQIITKQHILRIMEGNRQNFSEEFLSEYEIFRLFNPEGKIIALGRRLPGKRDLHPFLVF